LKTNDILISMTGNPGRVAKIQNENLPALLNQRVGKFEILNNDIISKEYFYHYVNSKVFENSVISLAHGSAQLNVSSLQIESVQIPLPPLDIQQKIVAEIEALEAKEKKAKEEVERLKESIYVILNIYPKGSISEICKVSDLKENPQNNLEKEYTYLGLEHLESDTGKIFMNKEFGEKILSTKNIFVEGDVLYGKLRPYLNKVAEPSFSGICSTDILVLKTKVPKILKYLLLSKDLVSQTSILMKGISLPRIGKSDFLNQKIPLPPLAEQKKIVAEIEKIETQLNALTLAISQVAAQKEAVLNNYL
ncbi:MAG: restriction endonuclease subunit S, partial [Bacteroidia bacterium]